MSCLPFSIEVGLAENYAEARFRFLQSLSAARGKLLRSYLHPMLGMQGEELATDVGWIGDGEARIVLVLISGTHGVEGFCGSAIQTALLETETINYIPEGIAILFVHALNPYGFSHVRRTDERNIDINRNFVDFHARPSNRGYEDLAQALLRPPTWLGRTLTRASFLSYLLRHGMRALQDAITCGQYDHPAGLFYGGSEPSWSNITWTDIIQRYLRTARFSLIIDYHTGLGRHGVGEIICPSSKESCAGARAGQFFGYDRVKYLDEGTSVSAIVQGDLLSYALANLPAAGATAIAIEFGTRGRFPVLDSLMASNWLSNRSHAEPQLQRQIRETLRRSFAPDDPAWRSAVWKRSEELYRDALKGLRAVAND